jgi:5-methylcytosine-specific restriction endonuclease McrA
MNAILERPTLVLNRNWQPVNIASVARSLVKVWNEAARIVDPNDYQLYEWSDWVNLRPADESEVIRTGSLSLRVPEVVVLTRFDRVAEQAVSFSRRNLYKRDKFTCQYCGGQPGPAELTVDHVVPRSHNGETSWLNCVLACVDCNARKANRTPEQAKMPLKREPIRPSWGPLFAESQLRIESWSKFVSEAYWQVELRE